MSKAIRWQIPFVSRLKTAYRVDIYDEGYTGSPVQLIGGTSPFTTDEDDSDDYFAPIRVQTGTLTVCTHDEDGNVLITLDDILPANNISRPVKLWRLLGGGAAGVLEWQGFLSCEAYDQDYTDIPQHLQLPVISVLEAMASVQLDQTRSSGLQLVSACLRTVLQEIDIQSGMTCFTNIYYSRTDYRILSKYIDMTVMFEQKEYNNENSTTYIVSGLSAKDALERLCSFMGWIAREKGSEIYLQRIGEEVGMYREALANFPGFAQDENITEAGIAATFDDHWAGVDHKRTIQQGAKSVEVVAGLKKYELKIEIPECPVGSLVESYYSLNNIPQYLYELGNSNAQAYSHCTFAYYAARCFGGFTNWEAYWQSTFQNAFSYMAAGVNSTAKNYRIGAYQFTFYAGAFLVKYSWENSGSATAHSTNNALHCIFFPRSINAGWEPNQSNFDRTKVSNIFSINSITDYRCSSGYLCVKAISDTIFMLPESPQLQHHTDLNRDWIVVYELQFGNKWWNGTSWQNTQCTFNATMTKNGFKPNWDETMHIEETEGLLIPISGLMSGIVTLKIWPLASSPSGYEMESQATLEMLFTQLSVDHILPDNDLLTDRSENHYFRLLCTNFRDEISIGTDLASMLNNQPSPSLIMNSETEAMTELNYGTDQVPDMRRPEVDLLNRLAAYYGAARQRLDLIVEHPTAAPLPLLRLNGISPDTRKYLPLAESRDWIEDTSTLTCFETPNNE